MASADDDVMLDRLQRAAFGYFLHEINDANGLVRDKSCRDWPASIAAVALGLTRHRRRPQAVYEDSVMIRRILTHLGLSR